MTTSKQLEQEAYVLKKLAQAGFGEKPEKSEESADAAELLTEGATISVRADRYERSRAARRACIEAHGATCAICGFDFAKTYGPQFTGIIQVHHVVPLHQTATDTGNVVLGVEELQGDLGAVFVDGVREGGKRRDLGIGGELGRGARGHDGRHVADDDVAYAALGKALIERKAALADGAVALLVTGGERREHDAVLKLDGPDLDGLE